MCSRVILKPGQRDTKKLCAEYGEWWSWSLTKSIGNRKIGGCGAIRWSVFGWTGRKMEQRHTVKAAGSRWNRARRLCELRYDRVVGLGLEGRIIRDLDD
jgi:hypothetical protein